MNWKCVKCGDGFDGRGTEDSPAVITFRGEVYFVCPCCASFLVHWLKLCADLDKEKQNV
jgi:hypothetical protein